jgi:hypothetical protein
LKRLNLPEKFLHFFLLTVRAYPRHRHKFPLFFALRKLSNPTGHLIRRRRNLEVSSDSTRQIAIEKDERESPIGLSWESAENASVFSCL